MQISTHTLRKEGDLGIAWFAYRFLKFQPTPSARRVTISALIVVSAAIFQPSPSARRVT